MGVSWELLRTSGSTKEGVQIRLGTLLGLVCLLLAAENGAGASWGCFWLVLGAPEGLFTLVLSAPEGFSRVEIGLTDAKNLAKKHKNDEHIILRFFCQVFGAGPRVKIDCGQFSIVSLLAFS